MTVRKLKVKGDPAFHFICDVCDMKFDVDWGRPSHYDEIEYCPFCGSEAFKWSPHKLEENDSEQEKG